MLNVVWFQMPGCCMREQWRNLVFLPRRASLTQATISGTFPGFCSNYRSGNEPSFWVMSNLAQARNHRNPLFHYLSSRLGEQGLLEQGLPTWARLVQDRVLVLFSSLMWLFACMIECFIVNAWSMMPCMLYKIKGEWDFIILSMKWKTWIVWLVLDWHENWMLEMACRICWQKSFKGNSWWWCG